MMKFDRLADNRLYFYEELRSCKCCKSPMLIWYANVPKEVYSASRASGVRRESYSDTGICEDCIKNGGFLRECSICETKRKFPDEFSLKTAHYPEYPDGETEYGYICTDCLNNRAKEVIAVMLTADETEGLKK